MSQPLRIAVLGAGLIGREHCVLLARTTRTTLMAIADPSEAAKSFANDLGAKHYADFIEMLDEVRPDGAIIALPNALHAIAAIACVERGIPCLVEKPVADTLEDARFIVAAVERTGVPVLVGHHRRYSPDIAMARKLVGEGALGRLVAVHGMWMADKPEHYFDATWRREPGGGPLLINLIHDIDCLRYICGDMESVMAFTSNTIRGFEVEDTASISVRFASGMLGTLLMSDTAVSPYNWDTASGQALYFPHQPENSYFISGTGGALAIPSMDMWKHETPGGNWQDPLVRRHVTLDGSRAYDNQLLHFTDMIRNRTAPLISAHDGMMTLATTLAISRSAQEKRPVSPSDLIGDAGKDD